MRRTFTGLVLLHDSTVPNELEHVVRRLLSWGLHVEQVVHRKHGGNTIQIEGLVTEAFGNDIELHLTCPACRSLDKHICDVCFGQCRLETTYIRALDFVSTNDVYRLLRDRVVATRLMEYLLRYGYGPHAPALSPDVVQAIALGSFPSPSSTPPLPPLPPPARRAAPRAPAPTAAPAPSPKEADVHTILVVENHGKILVVRHQNSITLPQTFDPNKSVIDVSDRLAQITGLVVKAASSIRLGNVVVARASLVGATVPAVAPEEIQEVEWVEPSALVNSPEWLNYRPALIEMGLWEAPAEERVLAAVFGSVVHRPPFPTPPPTHLDVAVRYIGNTAPPREVMQRVGEEAGHAWLRKQGRSDVKAVRVHHGLQIAASGKGVTFGIPWRVWLTHGVDGDRLELSNDPRDRGGVGHGVRRDGVADERVSIKRLMPLYTSRAMSLSSLLFSASTPQDLARMWRAHAYHVTVRLDSEPDGPLVSRGGFGLDNLRAAVRHMKHRGHFDAAMELVPWGAWLSALVKKEVREGVRAFYALSEENRAGILLLEGGIARATAEVLNQHPREVERMVFNGSRPQIGRMEAGDSCNLTGFLEPIPYHTAIRTFFRR